MDLNIKSLIDYLPKSWQQWVRYSPFIIGAIRWGLFLILRVIPAMFWRNMVPKKQSLEDGPDEFTKADVTAIIPVYQPPPSFMDTIKSLVSNGMGKILVVADITCHVQISELVKDYPQVSVIIETLPGKRAAMATGLKHVTSKLTCFVDDDVQWCNTFLEYLLHPFNMNDKIAGVGCEHRARYTSAFDIQMILADIRLSVRMLELFATSVADKGASCISGRTACYRTSFIQEDTFYDGFLNETYMGMRVVSGDDKFLTRYVMNKGGKIWHQGGSACYLTTTFERGPRFIKQLLRWSRNTWRSDSKCLFAEKKIWKNNLFTAFVMLDKMVAPFFLTFGLVYVPTITAMNWNNKWKFMVCWGIWLVLSRSIRVIYYLAKKPWNIIFMPVFIVFQYIQGLIRIYALFTVYERGWGTRNIQLVGNTIARNGNEADVAKDMEMSNVATTSAA
jgi:cellulose synthase/poly-beta-1,6-N-acetylglucosamine synthase-like glycosyltransferase